jgi:hypothetical protein
VLATYVLATVMCIWSLVEGVITAIDSSVPAGLAVVLAGTILLSVVAWRIHFKWNQLHGP